MAVSSDALTKRPDSGSPYQLDTDQVLRASSALLNHIKSEEKRKSGESNTKKLPLGDDDDEDEEDKEDEDEDQPSDDSLIWLILTTKKHIVDKNRLKPGKIPVPNSLNSAASLRICLITADPQRAVKDVVADPAFPKPLASRITRIVGYSKLKEKYKTFESRRQLLSEHDVFLADDRIMLRLIQTLGKTFFKSSKRPIPVRIEEIQKVDGKRVKKDAKKRPPTDEKYSAVAPPAIVAKEIERALACVPVHLAPAATAAIRVGLAGFTAEQLSENIKAVVEGMMGRFVPQGWRNIKAIHVKGMATMAMPIWLASELWLEDGDVLENKGAAVEAGEGATKAIEEGGEKSKNKKRKSAQADKESSKPVKRTKPATDGDEDAELNAKRKAKLQAQKAKAVSETDRSVALPATIEASKPTKKKKKISQR
ncbi:hypothetical protein FQN57_001406 [Myotisia sp. PD_48]|nr:hypothetical protein FQN57_001406 [Myotisia sp. PD_48]